MFIKQNDLKCEMFQICFSGLEIWICHFHFRHCYELTQIPGGMGLTVLTYPLLRGDQGATFETIQSFFGSMVLA